MIPDDNVPRLTVERHLNPDTGETSVEYRWDGKPVPQVTLTGAAAERLSGLALIQKDLANALRWIKRAEELISALMSSEDTKYYRVEDRKVGDEVKALFVASLVFYAKAFTEASGRRAQMSRDWLDPQFRELHDSFMSYRHNMAAHSGDEKLELACSYILLIPDKNQLNVRLATNRIQPDIAIGDNEAEKFSGLIENAIEKVVDKYNKLATQIIKRAVEKGSDFWIKASRKRNSIDVTQLLKRQS